ncbi:MAG: hypothetical protein DWQ37_14615 [Planctomycetota bacterium]|nr:MAG: hypothetical protein DWQ37_14615 [Planctomycetota bacterium]
MLVIVAVLAVRLGLTAARLDTAPGVLAVMLQDSTVGWLGWGHQRLIDAPAGRQADYWLDESERILAEHHTSEMARGAAWMLDSPGPGFLKRHLRATTLPVIPVDSDREAVAAERELFSSKASGECLALAELATQLAPGDPKAWRTRALLQFTPETVPRDKAWRAALEEGVRHDPENALYDYLIAAHLWTLSTGLAETDADIVVTVDDREQADEALALFEAGLTKQFPHPSSDDWHPILLFLKQSGVPRHEHPGLLQSRSIESRERLLWFWLARIQLQQAEQEPVAKRLGRIRNCLRLAQQISASADAWDVHTAQQICDVAAMTGHELRNKHRSELSSAEVQALEDDLVQIHEQNLVWRTALSQLSTTQPTPQHLPLVVVRGMLLAWALPFTLLLIAIAALAALPTTRVGRIRGAGSRPLGSVPIAICWCTALLLSFTLLGLAPAEVIGRDAQNAAAIVLMVAVPLGLIATVAIWRLRRGAGRPRFRTFIVATVALAVLARVATVEFAKPPRNDLYVPPRSFGGLDPAVLNEFGDLFQSGSLTWACFQWDAYSGWVAAIATALCLVAVWSWLRSRRTPDGIRSNWKTRVRSTLTGVRRSAAGAGLAGLVVFLALAPGYLRFCQATYDSQMAFSLEDVDRRNELQAEIRAVESDPALMKQLRQEARGRASRGSLSNREKRRLNGLLLPNAP